MSLDRAGLQFVSSTAELLQINHFVWLILLPLRRENIRTEHRERNQAEDDTCHREIERNFRLTCHDLLSVFGEPEAVRPRT